MSILITAKIHPDLDGVASIIAYQEFLQQKGKKVEGKIISQPQIEAQYLIKKLKLKKYLKQTNKKHESFILVDSAPDSLIGMPKGIKANKVIEVIDHRESIGKKIFKKAKIQNELVGAAATLIAEKFFKAKIKPSRKSALLLYTAIHLNTQTLKITNTTVRDKKMSLWLRKIISKKAVDELVQKIFFIKQRR